MNTTRKHIIAIALIAVFLLAQTALAETITFTGTVAASDELPVYAPIGGKVSAVDAEAGQKVAAGDALIELQTTKVYAEEAGTVTGVFGQVGDSADTVAQKYGAVISIEGESVYSISASTDNAYNSAETKFVHVGESVYLECYSDGKHTGKGLVTAIEGTDFTVRVTEGEFLIGETVNVYRGESATSSQRIGRGTLNRTNPTAVSGSGSIVAYAVQAGDKVARGDLLFETLDGSFDGLYMSGSVIAAGCNGTVAQVNAQEGGSIQKGEAVATLYPEGAMRVEASIEEANLACIAVGDPVSIELVWNQDEEVTYPGTITMISAIADSAASSTASASAGMDSASAASSSDSDTVTYTVYISFTPDENTRYGMSAVVTTLDAEEVPEVEDEPVGDEEEPIEDEAQKPQFDGEMPQFDGEMPQPEEVSEDAQQ